MRIYWSFYEVSLCKLRLNLITKCLFRPMYTYVFDPWKYNIYYTFLSICIFKFSALESLKKFNIRLDDTKWGNFFSHGASTNKYKIYSVKPPNSWKILKVMQKLFFLNGTINTSNI